jgi:beta-N-acetylhexosaminidase
MVGSSDDRGCPFVSHPRRSAQGTLLVLLAVLCAVAIACSSNGSPGSPTTSTASITPPTTSSPPSTATSPPPTCVDVTFQSLTPAQRVGQLFALGLANNQLGPGELGAIRAHHIGSFWFTETTYVGVAAIRAVSDAVQAQATSAATDGVRFFIAANQEGGLIQALRGPGFSTIPSAVTQGTMTPATLQKDAKTWGAQLARAGVNLNFAPVMDVVPAGTESQNAPIGALDRQYGSDPASVARHGAAFIRGMSAAGVVTTAKHFPGLGRVRGNTDSVAGVVDRVTTPNDPYLASFRGAIAAGVPLVMVSLATYTRIDPNHLAAFSPTVMQLLRDGLGFDGVIASDSLTATAVSNLPPAQRAIDFLSAGGDLVVSKTVVPTSAMAAAVLARTSSDPAFRAKVNDAVHRVLAAKDAAGLLPCSGD